MTEKFSARLAGAILAATKVPMRFYLAHTDASGSFTRRVWSHQPTESGWHRLRGSSKTVGRW